MYDGQRVVDVHGHVSTPVQFRSFAFNLVIGAPGGRDGQLAMSDDLRETAQKPHVQRLDEYNIEAQFISPRPVAMMLYERPQDRTEVDGHHKQRHPPSVPNVP